MKESWRRRSVTGDAAGPGAPSHPRAVRLWRRILFLRARDVTTASRSRSCLVLAAHPDDETLGCGATIARKRAAGTPVKVVVATDGRHSSRSEMISELELAKIRATEARDAATALGLGPEDLILLGHEDGSLASRVDELVEQVAGVVRDLDPDEILVASARDGHPDHSAISKVARRVIAPERALFKLAEYPIWYWYAGPVGLGPGRGIWSIIRTTLFGVGRSRPEVVATAGFLQAKQLALDAYRSQITNLTDEITWNILTEDFRQCFLQAYEIFFPVVG